MATSAQTKPPFSLPRDRLWLAAWLGGIALLAVWNTLFLNKPALRQVTQGFVNTFSVCVMVVAITVLLAWGVTLLLHLLDKRKNRTGYLAVTFVMNLIRSVPQIVGILLGYVLVAFLMESQTIRSTGMMFFLLAFVMSLFIFIEVVDLMRERIAHYQKRDFYHAMLVCGISESRIVNFDILWKNSRIHILNKLISVFGSAVFLQCSVDFIISVGLTTDVSSVNLPPTLGSLLAKIDSKQDILAIGYALTHPGNLGSIFFQHLQGATVAFLIVFTLLCVYNISNGYAERHRL